MHCFATSIPTSHTEIALTSLISSAPKVASAIGDSSGDSEAYQIQLAVSSRINDSLPRCWAPRPAGSDPRPQQH
jgi:hypothetical protein